LSPPPSKRERPASLCEGLNECLSLLGLSRKHRVRPLFEIDGRSVEDWAGLEDSLGDPALEHVGTLYHL
jgi:hypothetical protein